MIGPVLGPFFLRTVDLRSSHCRSDESSSQYTSAMANATITVTGKGKTKKLTSFLSLLTCKSTVATGCSMASTIGEAADVWRQAAMIAYLYWRRPA